MARAHNLSDLRLNADLRVDDEGKPVRADLKALVALPVGQLDPQVEGLGGVIYWCSHEKCLGLEFRGYRQALRHYGIFRFDRDYSTLEFAGYPHTGKASQTEQQLVRQHLDDVNRRLAASGLRQIDPANPRHATRYGFPLNPPQIPAA